MEQPPAVYLLRGLVLLQSRWDRRSLHSTPLRVGRDEQSYAPGSTFLLGQCRAKFAIPTIASTNRSLR
jgi:hypothetical protein